MEFASLSNSSVILAAWTVGLEKRYLQRNAYSLCSGLFSFVIACIRCKLSLPTSLLLPPVASALVLPHTLNLRTQAAPIERESWRPSPCRPYYSQRLHQLPHPLPHPAVPPSTHVHTTICSRAKSRPRERPLPACLPLSVLCHCTRCRRARRVWLCLHERRSTLDATIQTLSSFALGKASSNGGFLDPCRPRTKEVWKATQPRVPPVTGVLATSSFAAVADWTVPPDSGKAYRADD